MAETQETTAKELTLATISRMNTTVNMSAKKLGEEVGEIYKAVLRKVKEADIETGGPPKTSHSPR